jgi:signal transduction histidine kinase
MPRQPAPPAPRSVARPLADGLRLRTRVMLLVVLGGILPLGVVAAALAAGTLRSAESLLRQRLAEAAREAAIGIARQWVSERSPLFEFAESRAVQLAVADSDAPHDGGVGLRAAWELVGSAASGATLLDRHGQPRTTLAAIAAQRGITTFSVDVDVFDNTTGTRAGSVRFAVPLDPLLSRAATDLATATGTLAVLDADGQPLRTTALAPALLRGERFEWGGETWLTARHRLFEPPLTVVIAAPLDPLRQPFAMAARRGWVALLLVAGAGLLVAALFATRLTAPLERLGAGAAAVAAGNLEARVPLSGPTELRVLAESFNTMTESLKTTLATSAQREALAAVGEFAAGLAHEVRNPLTAMRIDVERALNNAQGTQHALLARVLDQLDRLDETVGGTLRMARSGRLPLELLDPMHPIQRAVALLGPAAARVEIRRRSRESLRVHANAAALEQLFHNLLRNASEAAGPAGTMTLEAGVTADELHIDVRDDGPGIPAELRDRIFEPFYSTKESGTGLGLPIAQRIARAHGGDISHIDTERGTLLRVRLPRAAAPATAGMAVMS